MTHTKLDEVYRLRKAGIFCIKNEKLKLMYISHSSCILNTLGTLCNNGKLDGIGIQDCVVELLYESNSRSMRLLHLAHYKHKLELLGYKQIANGPRASRYTLEISLYEDFRDTKLPPLVHVELRSQKAPTIVLGVFETVDEATSWTKATYGTLEPIAMLPKYSTNDLTMNYKVLYNK